MHDQSVDAVAAGSVMAVRFWLPGMRLLVINGGPVYKLSPAVSLMINCDTQEQVDYYWERLSDGGETHECGWVTDKFGLTWQVNWSKFNELTGGDTAGGADERLMLALFTMTKVDIATPQCAYAGD